MHREVAVIEIPLLSLVWGREQLSTQYETHISDSEKSSADHRC